MKPCRNGHVDGRYADGKCKGCVSARARKRYHSNPEKARKRRWRLPDSEQRHEERRARERWNGEGDYQIRPGHQANIRRKYGLSVAEFADMFRGQRGRCANDGCRKLLRNGGCTDALHIDHDHATGRVRGLLCGGCNTALGQLQDDPRRIVGLIRYLGGEPESQAAGTVCVSL